jgi:hypothetical protein
VRPSVGDGVRGGWAEPQGDQRWLHRLVDYGQHLRRDRVKIDFLTQPRVERLDGLGGVVSTAVEATVDPILEAPSERLEQRDDDERRDCHGQRGVGVHGGQDLPQDEYCHRVDRSQHEGEQSVRDCSADQVVDVEEAMAQNGDCDRQRKQQDGR